MYAEIVYTLSICVKFACEQTNIISKKTNIPGQGTTAKIVQKYVQLDANWTQYTSRAFDELYPVCKPHSGVVYTITPCVVDTIHKNTISSVISLTTFFCSDKI